MAQNPKLARDTVTIDLSGIEEGTHPLVLDAPGISLTLRGGEKRRFRDFAFDGTVTRSGADYRVRGSLVGTLESLCDRCLSGFAREIRTELEVAVVAGDVPPAAPGEASDQALRLPAGETLLDLAESFREVVLLEIPIKNVCDEDCRGLCPRCGVNRNEQACDCEPSGGDPRWDALRGLADPADREE
jgi:uncharacterized protein